MPIRTDESRTCCFTGHRPSKLPWKNKESDPRCRQLKSWLAQAISGAYEDGYRHFMCGMAMGCDLYFCEELIAFRFSHPDITIEAAIPCPDQAQLWKKDQQTRYEDLMQQCDIRTVCSPRYDAGCMLRRNYYMVDHSRRLIAVFNRTPGGTMKTVAYALQAKLELVQIDPDELT